MRGICGSVGAATSSRALGILAGPWAVGMLVHRLGNYHVPFLICAALALFAAALLGMLHHRIAIRREPARAAA